MTRRARYLTALPFVLLASSFAHAKDITPHDAYFKADSLDPTAAAHAAPGGYVASVDAKRGTPTIFWAQRGVALPAALKGASSERIATHHLKAHAKLWNLTSAALATAKPVLIHDTGRGGIIVVFRQKVGGVEVTHSDMKVLMTRAGELVAITGGLHPAATSGAQKKLPAFSVSSASAVARALEDTLGVPVPVSALADTKKQHAGYYLFGLKGPLAVGSDKYAFDTPARVKKVYYPMPGTLVPAYYVEITPAKVGTVDSDGFSFAIAADDGRVLMRRDLTAADSFNYRVWASPNGDKLYADGPLMDYNPHPTGTPDNTLPGYATPGLVSMEGFNTNPNGMVDPWLPAGATESKGNNVDAYTDHTDCVPTANTPCTQAVTTANDGFTPGVDIRATTTAPGEFDRTYDVTIAPLASQDQSMAAIVQLFYTTNWLHDYWYDSGFNEAAGNAQDDNFGRGGAEGDSLRAEAQDKAIGPPASRNNANMRTPNDGERPRMQMFLWSGQNDLTLDIGAPISQSYAAGSASFGPQNFDVMGDLILGDDGTAPSVTDGCEAITNNVAGKIVLVDRGTCPFVQKAINIQTAGGIGMLLANNAAGAAAPGMGGTDLGVTIGSLSTTFENGGALKTALAGGGGPITVHMARVSGVEHDGTIDNNIISHEWGHYLHHRLVDCGMLQCGGMSEGWADFVAVHQAVVMGDDLMNGTWATGQYATVSFPDEGYYGIRRLPYTRDTTKNPFTFQHLADENPLPPITLGFGGATNSEVHNAGEIWAQALFDAYTGLHIDGGHTFDEAKRRMADYIVAGMALAPFEPTFTEQMDSILAAASAMDQADMLILAQNIAGRGFGTCAVSPPIDTGTNNGVVEAFEVKGRHAILSATLDDSVKSCDLDGILDGNEAGKLTIDVTNGGPLELTDTKVTVVASSAGVIFPNGSEITIPKLGPYSKQTLTLDVALDDGFAAVELLDLTITAENSGSCIGTINFSPYARVNADDLVAVAITDTVDSEKSTWSIKGNDSEKIWRRTLDGAKNHKWHGDDFGSKSDTSLESPDIQVASAGNFIFTFDHAYSFETGPAVANGPDVYWDGAVIEITEDGGLTWTDVDQYVNPGYTHQISDLAENPLALRMGYAGETPSYPALMPVTLNFGSAFAGKTVRLRFRIGTDLGAGAPGWDIDNMGVLFATNTPFSAIVNDDGECNGVPVADAGPDQTAMSAQLVELDATGSSDPENDPLTFTWKQNAGPAATLFAGSTATPAFLAPEVMAPAILTFEVLVSDGKGAASDTVDVVVSPKPSMGTGGTGGSMGGTGGTGGTGGSMGGAGGSTGGEGGSMGGEGGSMGGEGGMSTGGSTTTTTTAGAGGNDTEEPEGGCNCAVAGDDSAPVRTASLGAFAALAGLFLRRRRGSRKPS